MSTLKLLALPGDHIGPEITRATRRVVETARRLLDLPIAIEEDVVGYDGLARHGHTIHPSVLERVRAADGVILGPCDTYGYPPPDQGGVNPSMKLRTELDLYANIRPSRTVAGVDAPVRKMDLVIVRENTEGFYADRNMFAGSGEFMPTPDVALAVRKITRQGSIRVARAACEIAMKRDKRLTIVSKANVLKLSDGLFRGEAERIAAGYPALKVEHVLVDAMASHLVRSPDAYDVIVTTNMFGDILSNQASELSGGLGLAGSLNAGDAHLMAQASHGSAPDISGQDKANPASLIFSVAMLFDALGDRRKLPVLQQAAALIDRATLETMAKPETRTADVGGRIGTQAFADAVCKRVEALAR